MKTLLKMIVLFSFLGACNNNISLKGKPDAGDAATDAAATTAADSATTAADDKTPVAAADAPAADETPAVECEDGKLCRGLTKEEVLLIVGQPDEIAQEWDGERLMYTEIRGKEELCKPSWASMLDATCYLVIRDGVLADTNEVNAKHLDPLNY